MPHQKDVIDTPVAGSTGSEMHRPSADIRSDEMTEIIGKMPHWIIRRGITIIAFLCLLLLTGAYFFKYPDIITAKVTISSGNPPVKLVARNSLPIQAIFVKNNEAVKKGQALCVFTNAARYEEVMQVETVVTRLDTSLYLPLAIQATVLPSNVQLGELQPNYVELNQALEAYRFFRQHNAYDATIGSLSGQMGLSRQLQAEQNNRQGLQQEQMAMQHRQFAADSSLLKAKVISQVEYEESRKRMLDQQMSAGNNKTTALQNQLQQSEYSKNIAIATFQKQQEENGMIQKIRDAIQRFQGQLAQWEQNYVLRSPADGSVSFFNIWKENQFVAAGEGIMMVIPPASNFIGRGAVGTDRYGKIKSGQKVLLKLQAYPYQEYGMLEAIITQNTRVAMDNNYAIELKLKHGLITNAGKAIPAISALTANAEIVTDDKSILSRLFEKIIGKMR